MSLFRIVYLRAVNLKKRLQNDEDPNIESIVTEYEEYNRRLLQYKNEIRNYLETGMIPSICSQA